MVLVVVYVVLYSSIVIYYYYYKSHDVEDDGGLEFVFPYGATLNAQKPAIPILSSGHPGMHSRPADL